MGKITAVHRIVIFTLSAISFSGCVSIATHEKMRQQCEQTAQEATSLRSQLSALQEKTDQLEQNVAQGEEKLSEVRSTYDELVENLKSDIAEGNVGVDNNAGKLTITMGNRILFKSGSADLQPKGEKVLLAVSRTLQKVTDNLIQVEGHTDSVAIAGSLKKRYASNWDLSAARAAAVVRFLQIKGGVDPDKLVLSAFAETRPAHDNSTPAGRELNRRVEITLIPKNQ